MEDPWADVAQAGRWLLDLAAQLQPDVVHLNGYCHADLEWAVLPISASPSRPLPTW